MLRTIIWFIYFFLYQIALIPRLRKANRLASENRIAELDAMVSSTAPKWALSLLNLAGSHVTVRGLENVPKNVPVVFVANHQSNFDIPLIMAYVGRPVGFIAKDSMEKFPFINKWMAYIHCVSIKRGSPREAAAAINRGIANLKAGHSMVIFPEGTRSPDGALQEFKPGALKLATKAGVPIVPVAISGSINLMRKGSWIIRPADVTLTVGEPILPEYYESNETNSLSEQIKTTIEGHLPRQEGTH